MLQNTFLDQSLDQVLEQEPPSTPGPQRPLVLKALERGERTASAASAARQSPSRHLSLDLYDVAIVLLLLSSLAAIVACFGRMN